MPSPKSSFASRFSGFRKFIQKVKTFIPEEEVAQELRLDAAEIVKMVKLQLARGLDGDGNRVTLKRHGETFGTYAPRTIRRKDAFGGTLSGVTEVITNYMSGRFYDSIKVEVLSDSNFEVYSTSPLYDIIKYRSGENIINLSPESERYLFENMVAPDLQEEINRLYFE